MREVRTSAASQAAQNGRCWGDAQAEIAGLETERDNLLEEKDALDSELIELNQRLRQKLTPAEFERVVETRAGFIERKIAVEREMSKLKARIKALRAEPGASPDALERIFAELQAIRKLLENR